MPLYSINRSMGAAILEGIVSASISAGHRYGYSSTASTAITPNRATAYVEPLSGSNFEVVSTSATDASGSTGTRKLRIMYYRTDGSGPFTADIFLSGTSPSYINDVNARFIERMDSLEVGSNGSNAGTISIRGRGNGIVAGTIAIGDGDTFWAHHYVDANKYCFINAMYGGATGNSCRMWMRTTQPLVSGSFATQTGQFYRIQAAASQMAHEMMIPVRVEGFARIEQVVRADSATAMAYFGGFSFYDVPKP